MTSSSASNQKGLLDFLELPPEREATASPEPFDEALLDSPPASPCHEATPRSTTEHSFTSPLPETEFQSIAAREPQYNSFNPTPAAASTRPPPAVVPPTHIAPQIMEMEANSTVQDVEPAENTRGDTPTAESGPPRTTDNQSPTPRVALRGTGQPSPIVDKSSSSHGTLLGSGISVPNSEAERHSPTPRETLNEVGGRPSKIIGNSLLSRVYTNGVAYEPGRAVYKPVRSVTPDIDDDLMIIEDPTTAPPEVQARWNSHSLTIPVLINDDDSVQLKQEPKEIDSRSQAPNYLALSQPNNIAQAQTIVCLKPDQQPHLNTTPPPAVRASAQSSSIKLAPPLKSRFHLPRDPLPGEFAHLHTSLPGNPRRDRQAVNDPNASHAVATSATLSIAARQRAMLAAKYSNHVNAASGPSSSSFGQRRSDAGKSHKRHHLQIEGQVVHDDFEQVEAAMRDAEEDNTWMNEKEADEDEEYENLNNRLGMLYRKECSSKINPAEKMEVFKLRKKLASIDKMRAAARGGQPDADEEESLFVPETREDVAQR